MVTSDYFSRKCYCATILADTSESARGYVYLRGTRDLEIDNSGAIVVRIIAIRFLVLGLST